MTTQAKPQGFDIYIVGVGGQGVLTIADFICQAAMDAGMAVSFFPTKGMAQRGGFVKAQLRIGKPGYGPSLPEGSADMAIAMERSEALKALRFLKPDGEFILYGGVWQPTAVMLKKAPYPAADEVKAVIREQGARLIYGEHQDIPLYEGAPVRENLFALGLAVGNSKLGALISPEVIAGLIEQKWPKVAAANLLAFRSGVALAQKQG